MTFTCQTNKVVNGAHLELSTETLVKFLHLRLISLDLEKTPRIWPNLDNYQMWKKKPAGITNKNFKTFFLPPDVVFLTFFIWVILFKRVKDPENDFWIVLCWFFHSKHNIRTNSYFQNLWNPPGVLVHSNLLPEAKRSQVTTLALVANLFQANWAPDSWTVGVQLSEAQFAKNLWWFNGLLASRALDIWAQDSWAPEPNRPPPQKRTIGPRTGGL